MFSVGIGVAKKNVSLKLINVINLLKINFDRTKSPAELLHSEAYSESSQTYMTEQLLTNFVKTLHYDMRVLNTPLTLIIYF